jgi:hypothetical protein
VTAGNGLYKTLQVLTRGVRSQHSRAILWAVAALLTYLAGAVVFLSVIWGAIGETGFDAGDIGRTGMLVIVASAGMFLLGGYCFRRAMGLLSEASGPKRWPVGPGQSGTPEPSDLPEQYRSTAAPADAPEPSEHGPAADAATTACPHCGAENEPAFDYCWHCSGEL